MTQIEINPSPRFQDVGENACARRTPIFRRLSGTAQRRGNPEAAHIPAGGELRNPSRASFHQQPAQFGKTESGTVWLDPGRTSPYLLYQFFLNADDAVVGQYLRYFTFLTHEQIEALDVETATRPERRAAQRAVAKAVCALVHGPEETERAERASAVLFAEEIATLDEQTLLALVDDAPSGIWTRRELGTLPLVDVLVASGLVSSKSDARRAISQGGIYVNNRREPEAERVIRTEDLLHDRYVFLRRGRRDYHVLRFE